MYDSITDRFKKYVKNYNVNLVELSKQIGVSHGVLTSITGKSSKRNLSANVREALRLHRKDIYDLITAGTEISMVAEASYEYNRTARISHIPRQAAAGDILASMDPVKDDDLELFHMPDLRPGVYFSIYARGDSMENTIYDGELLICSRLERIEDARDGYIHVICSNQVDEGFVVKRIFKKLVGGNVRSLELRSDNPFYPPVTLQSGKIQAIFQVRRTIRARFPPPFKEINEDLIALKNTVDDLKNLLDKKL